MVNIPHLGFRWTGPFEILATGQLQPLPRWVKRSRLVQRHEGPKTHDKRIV